MESPDDPSLHHTKGGGPYGTLAANHEDEVINDKEVHGKSIGSPHDPPMQGIVTGCGSLQVIFKGQGPWGVHLLHPAGFVWSSSRTWSNGIPNIINYGHYGYMMPLGPTCNGIPNIINSGHYGYDALSPIIIHYHPLMFIMNI